MPVKIKEILKSYLILIGRYILGFIYFLTFSMAVVRCGQNSTIIKNNKLDVDTNTLMFVNVVYLTMVVLFASSLLVNRKIMLWVWLIAFWIILMLSFNIADMTTVSHYFWD